MEYSQDQDKRPGIVPGLLLWINRVYSLACTVAIRINNAATEKAAAAAAAAATTAAENSCGDGEADNDGDSDVFADGDDGCGGGTFCVADKAEYQHDDSDRGVRCHGIGTRGCAEADRVYRQPRHCPRTEK